MEGFDLGRLNPTSFERLVRALCFAEMGPAGVVFSSGPDGARDFIYEGGIKGYESKRWRGYLVVQAKFKDPSISKTDDLVWLKSQVDAELKKYMRRASRLKRPQYYILVTNLKLSGSDGAASKKSGKSRKGGLTKAQELFVPWKEKLKIRDFDIWPHDKVIDLLAAHPPIRQSYAHLISSGDVLAKALQYFTSVRPNFAEVMNRSLKNLLWRDQFVRLKDAGSVGDLQIRTSQVIVDLPLDHIDLSELRLVSRYEIEQDFLDDSEEEPRNAIAQLVERARDKLDPETSMADTDDMPERQKSRNRIVIMGGPGQGKSTISLFLTQLFRATILSRQSLRRDQNVNGLVSEILKRAEGESIPPSFPQRFPCHVSLPKYADAISAARQSKEHPPSLLSYIASDIGHSADDDVDRSDLRKWLRDYPWLLVLDGLDEVPPSGERPAVLEAIGAFLIEVGELNADVLVVVTTRPQGYNKDLDEKTWEHWRLADLGPSHALRYAKAFGEARYPSDVHRRAEVHRALTKAAAQPATARLMITPLQVTHFIVDTGGGVCVAHPRLLPARLASGRSAS